MCEANQARQAVVRQQLLTDRLLGAEFVPVYPQPPVGQQQPAAEPTQTRPQPSDAEVAAKAERLRQLDEQQVRDCAKCHLSRSRTRTVFGQGHASARIVFVGEAPGFEEDRQGLAFVGRAGELLTRILENGMGLKREEVFICNVLKCRPPENRTPSADEIAACSPYLIEQIQIIQPEVIVALGAPAAQTLLGTRQSIGKLRGRWHEFYPSGSPMIGPAIPLLATFHPAYLLRSPDQKPKAWEDLKMVMSRLGLAIPERYR